MKRSLNGASGALRVAGDAVLTTGRASPLTLSHSKALKPQALWLAGGALAVHLSQVMPPLLLLASQAGEEGDGEPRPRVAAALEATRRCVLAVQEEGAYLLIQELTKVRPPGLSDRA